MKILVTGASGFVGKALCNALEIANIDFIPVVRKSTLQFQNKEVVIKELTPTTLWADALEKVDVVIHLANRAHIMREKSMGSYAEYKAINVDATINLAKQAIKAGVKRFIFISSIGVNGNQTLVPFKESHEPNPQELYAISKKNAEDELYKVTIGTSMEFVTIRPPLVYGNGAKGNFEQLSKVCSLNLPLPFGEINNKRNLIYVENLVDFIVKCINHPRAANEVFLVADDEAISIAYLIKSIKSAMGKKALLFPIPQKAIHFLSTLIGKQALYNKLCGNLQVDNAKAKKVIGWKPPYTFDEGIKKTFSINKNGKKNF